MMKKTALYLLGMAACVLVMGTGGCTKEKSQLSEGEPCSFSLAGKALQIDDNAGTETLPDNLELGVYIVDRTSGEELNNAAWTNIKYVTDASGAMVNTDPNPIVLTTGYTYDVYAYSPYDEGVTGGDVSSVLVIHGQDVLWAKAAGEKPNAATHSTKLIFEHKTAQISFNPVADPVTNPDLTGARLSVAGFMGIGYLDMATGKVTADPKGHSVQYMGANEYFCFLPADAEMTLYVTVEIPSGPNQGTYSGAITQLFEPGCAYNVTVTVADRNSKLNLQGRLTEWVEKNCEVNVNN